MWWIWGDLGIFVGGWLLAQFAFAGYEAHVSRRKRIVKFVVMLGLFAVVHRLGGRLSFYSLLGLMSLGMAILHGYWFHHKHGIHWRTAQPRDKYLELIGKGEDR